MEPLYFAEFAYDSLLYELTIHEKNYGFMCQLPKKNY